MSTSARTEKIAHGIKRPNGEVITDPTWFCEADVIRGMSPWVVTRRASEVGVLVQYVDGEWKEKGA